MMTEADIETIKRNGALRLLSEAYRNKLRMAQSILNPIEPNSFHGHRAEVVRKLIDDAEALSLEIEKITPKKEPDGNYVKTTLE